MLISKALNISYENDSLHSSSAQSLNSLSEKSSSQPINNEITSLNNKEEKIIKEPTSTKASISHNASVLGRVWVNRGCISVGTNESLIVKWKLPPGSTSFKDCIGLFKAGIFYYYLSDS